MTEPTDSNRAPRPEEGRKSQIPRAFGTGVALFLPALILLGIGLIVILFIAL